MGSRSRLSRRKDGRYSIARRTTARNQRYRHSFGFERLSHAGRFQFALVKKAEQEARLNICLKCEHCVNNRTCAICSCNLLHKTWKPDWACPIGKWGAIDTAQFTHRDPPLQTR